MTTITARLRSSIAAFALVGAASAGALATASPAGAATSPAAATKASAASTASTLSAVRRNCGIVTCSWYLSKNSTRNLKDQLGSGTTFATGAAYMICSKIPHPMGMAVCAAAIVAKGWSAGHHIVAAANRGGCFVARVNMAYMLSNIAPLQFAKGLTFDDVPLSNKYCDAA
ncbi:hypothetical protein [Sphaerisporangium fuscum]|uniref:hypothetical protein n=1 Tax=Sphaerisporangium fuscum TaxID=2835868 RepID=UPI001BDD498A|nr:hypothetical protein [Sphaerisporangium fuscum]